MIREDDFAPDWASAPGESIADILEERSISLEQFAKALGYTRSRVNALMRGQAAITPDIARLLESVLGGSAQFWTRREFQYREDLHRLEARSDSENDHWLKELPLADMVAFQWIRPQPTKDKRIAACLEFFGTPNVATWRTTYGAVIEQAAYKTSPSFESTPAAVAAWLRQGEIEAASIRCARWDPKGFADVLTEVRTLTREKDPDKFLPKLRASCSAHGVAVVVVRSPSGCRASGATRFLSPTKALLLLSFRYLSDDHFWFTFFHEAGHLILHSESALFLEGDQKVPTREEQEANEFAAKILVPPQFQATLRQLHADHRQIMLFARRVGVSPGIVVGQLQYLGRLRRNQLNSLKRRFEWT